MVLLINRPMKRSGSSREYFRKRVPTDVLAVARGKQYVVMLPCSHSGSDHIRVKFTLGTDVRFSLRTPAGALARLRNAAATEQVERLFAEISAGPPPPQSLSPKQIVALAGEMYRLFAETLEEDPGIVGRLEVWGPGRSTPHMIIRDIERTAVMRASEDAVVGLRVPSLTASATYDNPSAGIRAIAF